MRVNNYNFNFFSKCFIFIDFIMFNAIHVNNNEYIFSYSLYFYQYGTRLSYLNPCDKRVRSNLI